MRRKFLAALLQPRSFPQSRSLSYVFSYPRFPPTLLTHLRATLETQEAFWVLRDEPSHSPSTTSHKTRVRRAEISHICFANKCTGEKARITAAGGFVDFGRVNGNLALSRAIGDFEFKKSAELAPEQQIVTAYPDVTVHDIHDDDEFLVVACDGKWFFMQSLNSECLHFYRYLGLPIVSSRCRIRPSRYCC